ncbi:MAG: S9 family peptidase [Halioglobus sp.]
MLQTRTLLASLVIPLLLLLGACASTPPANNATAPQLIDRELLFGNPSRFQGRLSPDGTMMSFRAPLKGVMNLWVAPAGDLNSARAITQDSGRGIPSHFWTLDSQNVLYIQDRDGDENWHLYRVNVRTGATGDLTPYEGINARFIAQSERHPGQVVVGINDRDPRWHDAYQIDLATGQRKLLAQNDGFAQLFVDHDLQVRLGSRPTDEGGQMLYRLEEGGWEELAEIPLEDASTTNVLGFDADNEGVYMLDSRGRNNPALTRMALASGQSNVLAESSQGNIDSVLFHPQTHKPIALAFNQHQKDWRALDEAFARDIKALESQADGDAEILATTLDGNRWTLYISRSDRSPEYAVYDRADLKLTTLFRTDPALTGLPMVAKENVTIRSRDGRDLISYLTLPTGVRTKSNGRPSVPLPMVLLVHGGPWGRDTAGFDGKVQWLANRGYAVLQVNFRGSTGFGKDFINAGNYQWAGDMHNDLLDAVQWAITERIAAQNRIAIMGGSYGGYATLVGLTFTPDVFACGVDIAGPSNLDTLIQSIPPYWAGFRTRLVAALGDPDTPPGQALLKERSPLYKASNIKRPLLIGQGANDPRVKQAESDQIVSAMNKLGIPVTYVLYPDEGHGFQKPENRLSFYAVTESFLSQCLGGRQQPIGDDFENSSIQILDGEEHIRSLSETQSAP